MEPSVPPSPPPLRERFSVLMREHHRELIAFASAATGDPDGARDVVQDAFVAAWKKFAEFDHDRDFGAWMRGFVRFKAKDWFRQRGRDPIPDSDFVAFDSDFAEWQATLPLGETIFDQLERCVAKLPANFRSAVRTFYFESESGADAATALAISPANLRKRLERARALLHDCLSAQSSASVSTSNDEVHV